MLKVKIADNPYLREKGLMFVEHLPEDEGMLFIFSSKNHLSFWGKNTLIPLDIAFIDDNYKILKIAKIDALDLSAVSCDTACKIALEVNASYFENKGISEGDTIEIQTPVKISGIIIADEAIISFKKGENSNIQKDNSYNNKKLREGQILPENGKVDKIDDNAVGNPITQNVNGTELPVVDVSNLGEILEDSYDESEQMNTPEEENGDSAEFEQNVDEDVKYPTFGTAFEATEWAEENNEVVRISYTTKHGRFLIRDVEPHGKFHSQSTHKEILVTWDETIGDIRAFIVSNISKWAFVKKKFNKKFTVKV